MLGCRCDVSAFDLRRSMCRPSKIDSRCVGLRRSMIDDLCVDLRKSMIDVSTFDDRCVDLRRSMCSLTFEDQCVDLQRSMIDVKLCCYTCSKHHTMVVCELRRGFALQSFHFKHVFWYICKQCFLLACKGKKFCFPVYCRIIAYIIILFTKNIYQTK